MSENTTGVDPRWLRRADLERQQNRERDALLVEHNKRRATALLALQLECAAEGHTDNGKPGNDSSYGPSVCWHCGARIDHLVLLPREVGTSS